LLAALLAGDGAATALITTLGDVAEGWLAAELLWRAGFEPGMWRVTDVMAYTSLAAVVATAVSAALGTLSVWAGGVIGSHQLVAVWREWWLGDLTGALIVGAPILVVSRIGRELLLSWRALRGLLAAVAVAALSYLILESSGALPYLVMLLLFGLAFIYRQSGATLGSLVVASVAVILTRHGHGPFLGGGLIESLTRAETFLAVGSVTGLMVAAALTERRSADEARTQLEESRRALVEAQHLASVGSFEIDLASQRTTWSDEVFNIVGLSPEQMRPEWSAWREVVVAEDLEHVDAFSNRLHEQAGEGSIVHRIIRADGQLRWIELRLRYLDDPRTHVPGRPVLALGTCHDITPEVVAEQRAQALFQNAPSAILVIQRDGTIVRANRPAQLLFGAEFGDLEGMPIERFLRVGQGAPRRWYLESEEDRQSAPELLGRAVDGLEFPAEVALAPLPSVGGDQVLVSVRDVTRLREQTETLNFQARHDPLTGLPNRLMLFEHLELALARARRSRRLLALVFVDLDDFKLVNDRSGHDAGDQVLAELSRRLTRAVREGDMVARLGGDEFVALCEDIGDHNAAVDVTQRLVHAVKEPFALDGEDHTVSLSAGVVMVDDPDRSTGAGVLRDADAAMYAAKAAGKGRLAFFNPRQTVRGMHDVALDAGLRGALAREELVVHYQPMVAIEPDRLRGFEALVRWRHASRGLLMPG
ncbi:MAG TPA: diguanylate cyclase, partial [Solirubrobacteraceae bacterium]|nr:diguanylate cyclase [Solirubrobacteraceae bacterium]